MGISNITETRFHKHAVPIVGKCFVNKEIFENIGETFMFSFGQIAFVIIEQVYEIILHNREINFILSCAVLVIAQIQVYFYPI